MVHHRSLACVLGIAFSVSFLFDEKVRSDDCLYVGGQDGISVVDAHTLAEVALIPGGPAGTIAVDHARLRAYFASRAFEAVDLTTNTIVTSIAFPPATYHVRQVVLGPEGSRLYALGRALTGTSKLVAVDLQTETASSPSVDVDSFGDPFMDVTPDGKFLYVARPPFGVSVIDTDTFSNVATVAGSSVPYWIAIAPDGKRAYTVDPGNTVSVIDIPANAVVEHIKIDDCRTVNDVPFNCGSNSLAISPDGRYLYVVNATDESIEVLETATNSEVTVIRFGDPTFPGAELPHPVYMAISRDGHTLAVTHSDLDFELHDPNFIWVFQKYPVSRVAISQPLLSSFADLAIAIASVPSGCTGAIGSASATLTSTPTVTCTTPSEPTTTPTKTDAPTPTFSSTATPTIPRVGDCDNDGAVAIDDLLVMVNVALDNLPPDVCPGGDANDDGKISVEEIIATLNIVLNN
jgi:YVTN family beta-propeller protein